MLLSLSLSPSLPPPPLIFSPPHPHPLQESGKCERARPSKWKEEERCRFLLLPLSWAGNGRKESGQRKKKKKPLPPLFLLSVTSLLLPLPHSSSSSLWRDCRRRQSSSSSFFLPPFPCLLSVCIGAKGKQGRKEARKRLLLLLPPLFARGSGERAFKERGEGGRGGLSDFLLGRGRKGKTWNGRTWCFTHSTTLSFPPPFPPSPSPSSSSGRGS